MNEQAYYTVKEVAKRFKKTEQFIRNEIVRKRLNANLIGREWRISRRDVSDYERLTRATEDDLIGIGA